METNNVNKFSHSYSPTKSQRNFSTFTKTFQDPVHGQIVLHPACTAVIDTPQFQRLRSLKQTGFVEFVYPGATQNRFSHSLGVCFLAGKFIQELRDHQPELLISDSDVLCIELAGLCHDLGHGPFSHAWENYMKEACSRRKSSASWKHENVSITMLDYLIEENNLGPLLNSYCIGEQEINLIKDIILGIQPQDGRRAFLYQIVNNEVSGLDVDKWDYFLRDCHALGLPCSFEYERLIQFAKVFMVDGRSQICFRDKVLESVYNVFRTRSNLHRIAYQHKVVIITDRMFLDAFHLADGKCIGPSGEVLQFWDWSMCAAYSRGKALRTALERYCMLTDSVVFSCLKYAKQPAMQKPVSIIRAIEKRSFKTNGFYQHIGLKILPYKVFEKDVWNGLCQLLPTANERVLCSLVENYLPGAEPKSVVPEEIAVSVICIHWGKGDQNPVDFVQFYSKDCVFSNRSENYYEVSAMLPKTFQEVQVHVICRRNDEFAFQVARWCFENYWNFSPKK